MSTNEPNRSYGQGAQGEIAPATKSKIGIWARLRYNFDNSIAKAGTFVLYVLLLMMVIALIMVGVKSTLLAIPALTQAADPANLSFFDLFWASFTKILSLGGEPTWADRIVAVMYWVTTTALTASVIGYVVGAIQRTFARLRKGRSPIVDANHTLILGWSSRIFPILQELAIANQNVRKPVVVIFAPHDREFMEDEIESRTEDLGKLKIVTRNGEPSNPIDLKRTNISNAKSVIILDSDETGDANVVSTVLAVKAVNSNPNLKIVAELDDADTAEAITVATQGQVLSVRSHEVIARVTAQASRQPGLSTVILDLLDFSGDEIYFSEIPALEGKTYADALLSFNTASVIGILDAKGKTHLNPKPTTKISKGSKIIAIAQDDDQVTYTGTREELVQKAAKIAAPAAKPEHLLVIGWSEMGRSVIAELAAFLPKGSTVHILARKNLVAEDQLKSLDFGSNIKVTTASVTGDIDDLTTAASARHYDEVIVLGYRNAISEAEADAQTMLTMLQMNRLFEAPGNGVEPTRLVAEILDGRKAEIARVAAVDDLVVSDNLAALLIAQLSENPGLAPVFEDLFDADGASLSVRDIALYASVGKEVSYAQLVANARAKGESAIGYRSAVKSVGDAAAGVKINPSKEAMFTPQKGDSLIVVADTIR
jgi:K+/H+ antiporter YhaU regulatory subunit KhtT